VLVGHYAVALLAKRAEPRVNLGTWVFAAMFADIAWCVLMIMGLEQVQFHSGMGAGRYFYATNVVWSHSLLTDAVWAALLGSAYFWIRRDRRGAWIIFLVVLSHWVLDFVSWRPDLPIAPELHRYVGLGLWNSIPATLFVEGGFWLLTVLVYVRFTRSKGLVASFLFWAGIGFLTLSWLSNIAGPPPKNPKAAPFASLIIFSLTLVWAYGADRWRLAAPQRSQSQR
jgi:hypothetical protein